MRVGEGVLDLGDELPLEAIANDVPPGRGMVTELRELLELLERRGMCGLRNERRYGCSGVDTGPGSAAPSSLIPTGCCVVPLSSRCTLSLSMSLVTGTYARDSMYEPT